VTTYDRQPTDITHQPAAPRSGRTVAWAIGRAIVWVVYAFVVAAIVIATLAFFLQLFGANPTASFSEWVYRSAARVMQPFRGIFPPQPITGASVFNTSLLFGIIMYSFFALFVSELVDWMERRRDRSASRDLYNAEQADAPSVVDLTDSATADPSTTPPAKAPRPVHVAKKRARTSV